MKLDTQPLLLRAARLALAGYMSTADLNERRKRITSMEGQLATREEHVASYEESKARLTLDGTPRAFKRWNEEQQLLIWARTEVERLEAHLRIEVEGLEREVAMAQQAQARALTAQAQKEARA
jgi:hypothetical protein